MVSMLLRIVGSELWVQNCGFRIVGSECGFRIVGSECGFRVCVL